MSGGVSSDRRSERLKKVVIAAAMVALVTWIVLLVRLLAF
jgi:hypothetical protein